MMRRAAELWAEARLHGVPTAPADSLDADAILAAQALAVGGAVVTTNPRHLGRYVLVRSWADIESGMR
jgi:predicted nucleic acid-binding protein